MVHQSRHHRFPPLQKCQIIRDLGSGLFEVVNKVIQNVISYEHTKTWLDPDTSKLCWVWIAYRALAIADKFSRSERRYLIS
jgi:hypothetical protein